MSGPVGGVPAPEALRIEVDAGVAIVRLDRPNRMNALDRQLLTELEDALDRLAAAPDVRAVVLTGTAECFSAGGDLRELAEVRTVADAEPFCARVQRVFAKLAELPQPAIAAVAGVAFGGGCELCLACDLRVAAEGARFALPEVKVGLIPGGGGTQRLSRLVGLGLAKELLFTGDPIDAQEAHRIGLVNRVVPPERLLDEACALARKLAERPTLALRALKRLANEGSGLDLRAALSYETRWFTSLFGTEDKNEGVAAFLERRKPAFRGR